MINKDLWKSVTRILGFGLSAILDIDAKLQVSELIFRVLTGYVSGP
jgi:hypothetical protein